MRKSLIILTAIVFCMFGALSASAQNGYNLELEPANASGQAQTAFNQGDTVKLNINLNANSPGVAGCAFTLLYDATRLTAPVTSADGLSDGITSIFPFTTTVSDVTTQTHRANSTESGKIYFSGAEITADGGSKVHPTDVTLFTVTFTIPAAAPSGTAVFTLQQTTLTNTAAGWNGDSVPVIVGAIPKTDANFGGDLSDDFPVMLGDATHPFTAITAPIQIGDATYCTDVAQYGIDCTALFGGEQEDYDHDGFSNSEEIYAQPPTDPNSPTGDPKTAGVDPADPTTWAGMGATYSPCSDFRVANLDIDGNGKAELGSDGVLLMRYLFGYTGDTLINGAVSADCTKCTAADIQAYIGAVNECVYDVDASGKPTLGGDGVIIMRYMFGYRGEDLIKDAITTDPLVDDYCNRCDPDDIAAYIQLLFPN